MSPYYMPRTCQLENYMLGEVESAHFDDLGFQPLRVPAMAALYQALHMFILNPKSRS